MNCSARCTTKSTRRNRRRQRACATDVRACLRALCCAAGAAASTAPALRLRTGDRAATELSLPRKVAFGSFPFGKAVFLGFERPQPAATALPGWLGGQMLNRCLSRPQPSRHLARFGSTRAGAGCHRQPRRRNGCFMETIDTLTFADPGTAERRHLFQARLIASAVTDEAKASGLTRN